MSDDDSIVVHLDRCAEGCCVRATFVAPRGDLMTAANLLAGCQGLIESVEKNGLPDVPVQGEAQPPFKKDLH